MKSSSEPAHGRIASQALEQMVEGSRPRSMLRSLMRLIVPAVADFCLVEAIDGEGQIVRLESAHIEPEKAALLRSTPEKGLTVAVEAREMLEHLPALLPNLPSGPLVAYDSADLYLRAFRPFEPRSLICVPVSMCGVTVGWLLLFRSAQDRAPFGSAELAMARELAAIAETVIENERLLDLARQQKRRAEAAAGRSALLLRTSQLLEASLDDEPSLLTKVLLPIARLVVASRADICVIDLLGSDGQLRCLVAAGGERDPRLITAAAAIMQRMDVQNDDDVRLEVARKGRARLITLFQDALLSERPPQLWAELDALSLQSVLCVPLIARHHTLGVLTWVSCHAAWRYDEDDLTLAEDVAGRAALAVDNARLFHRAEQGNRMKDEFLATLSHELRTPLAAMLPWTQLLRSPQLDEPTRRQAIGAIERSVTYQAQLISDLTDVARIIAGKLRLRLAKVSLGQIVEKTLSRLQSLTTDKRISLSIRVPPDLQLTADPARLEQVLWQLLSNAVHFTSENGQVTLEASSSAGMLELRVRDTGEGISAEELLHVFEHRPRARKPGLGVGLALVRHLVELHQGTVEALSDGPGTGATFVVRLPGVLSYGGIGPSAFDSTTSDAAMTAARSDSTCSMTSASSSASAEAAKEPVRLDNMKLLLVDDEEEMRTALGAALERLGASVRTASSVGEALFVLDELWPDVVLTDVNMPGPNGYALLNAVRTTYGERGRTLPVAALTGATSRDQRKQSSPNAFSCEFEKPIRVDELARGLKQLCAQSNTGNR